MAPYSELVMPSLCFSTADFKSSHLPCSDTPTAQGTGPDVPLSDRWSWGHSRTSRYLTFLCLNFPKGLQKIIRISPQHTWEMLDNVSYPPPFLLAGPLTFVLPQPGRGLTEPLLPFQ